MAVQGYLKLPQSSLCLEMACCVTTAQRIPFPIRDKVKQKLDRMEKNGIIEKVTTPTDWCAPLVPVKKKKQQDKDLY